MVRVGVGERAAGARNQLRRHGGDQSGILLRGRGGRVGGAGHLLQGVRPRRRAHCGQDLLLRRLGPVLRLAPRFADRQLPDAYEYRDGRSQEAASTRRARAAGGQRLFELCRCRPPRRVRPFSRQGVSPQRQCVQPDRPAGCRHSAGGAPQHHPRDHRPV